jgi:hypothetical protein
MFIATCGAFFCVHGLHVDPVVVLKHGALRVVLLADAVNLSLTPAVDRERRRRGLFPRMMLRMLAMRRCSLAFAA